jgi:hypothetical protein
MLPPKVYTDGVGIVVEVVPLIVADGSEAQALVRVSGVENSVSGVTFLTRRSPPNKTDAWTASINGKTFSLLQTEHSKEGPVPPRLYLPHTGGLFVVLSVKPEASKLVNIDELMADYKSHLQDGSLKKLAEFDHDHARQIVLAKLERIRGDFSEACGKSIEVEMDWDDVSTPTDYQQAHFCSSALLGLSELCDLSLDNKERIRRDINHLRCHLEDEVSLRYEPGSKTWDVGANASNIGEVRLAATLASKSLALEPGLFKSASGLYVLVSPLHAKLRTVHAGSSTTLYRQWTNRRGDQKYFNLWDIKQSTAFRTKEVGVWTAFCPAGEIKFEEVSSAERRRVLDTAKFEDPVWTRQAMYLARDSQGTYYYVDRQRKELGWLDYRVYKGPKGRLRATQMVDVVSDNQGHEFITSAGTLRFIWSGNRPSKALWAHGKKTSDLVIIGVTSVRDLIHGDLGVYEGQETGTLCSLADGHGG